MNKEIRRLSKDTEEQFPEFVRIVRNFFFETSTKASRKEDDSRDAE